MALNTDIRVTDEGRLLVSLDGDLDIYVSDKFKEEVLSYFIDDEMDIIIDGSKLDFIDSTGLGVLISILKEVKEKDKKVYIDNIKPNIRKIFDITKLDNLFIFRGEVNE